MAVAGKPAPPMMQPTAPMRPRGEGDPVQAFPHTMAAGRRDDGWKANSAGDDGCLDLGGRRIVLIRDTRLARF
jgi:hypothetical protein